MALDQIRLRRFAELDYYDPISFLKQLRVFECELAASETPEPIMRLRTGTLKTERELRDAALFCAGMSECIGQQVWMAAAEDQDHDFIASWTSSGARHFCPVQLKEVVPEDLNADSSIEAVIDKLHRYSDSFDLTVAIKLGRNMRFDPSELKVPDDLTIGELWVFGAVESSQSAWALWGNFLAGPVSEGRVFSYPK
tara:strand:+ start:12736 stop:13323 length:588 start_codon:yes stop_codon:yes gene_type:complete